MKDNNVCIWKLKKTIDDIVPLLDKTYFREVQLLVPYNISEDEKNMIYRWGSIDGNFNVNKACINKINLRYIKAVAEVEVNKIPENQWVVDENVLPKKARVVPVVSKAIFVERLGSTYCIIMGPKSSEGRIRSNLMETSKRKNSSWGEVKYTNVEGYIFNKHFYYWLIKNKDKILNIDGRKVRISEVKGFKGDTDRTLTSYSGKGSNIDDEIPLQSLISMDVKLISLYIDITVDEISYNFFLDYDGRINFNRGECGQSINVDLEIMTIEQILLNIYYDIIPLLLKGYNASESSGWLDIENKFKKELSIDVIKKLMKQNGINIREIEDELLKEKSS